MIKSSTMSSPSPSNKTHLTTLIFIFLFIPNHNNCVNSANILFYFGLAGHSHINSLWPVIEALAESGAHNVSLLTTFEPKATNPKVNIIYAKDIYELFKDLWDEGSDLLGARMENKQHEIWNTLVPTALTACKTLLEGPATTDLVHNSAFDLVVFDTIFNECGMGLAHYKYKCPFIAYSAISSFPYYPDDYGYHAESSIYPDMEFGYNYPMSFYEKIITTLQPIKWHLRKLYNYYPELDSMFKEKLNLKEEPSFATLHSKTSLILHNSHFSNEHPRSLPPLFVSIAGAGVKTSNKPLPKELEDFISKPGSEGFIYISFGTVARISKSHPSLRNKFFGAIAQFPNIQFVWKWEGNETPKDDNVPKNIYFASWLPQQDLLAHKKIKGFLSHGGLNSVHEATHHGIPMIIFPILGDQDYNANTLTERGQALTLEITKFTQEQLQDKIQKLLADTEFQARVKQASEVFHDRPMKPLETALWRIEYVLRNKNTSSFLMPIAASTQSWYERRLLDVWFTLFTILILGSSLVIFIIYKLICLFLWESAARNKNNNNNIGTRNGLTNGHTTTATTNGFKNKLH